MSDEKQVDIWEGTQETEGRAGSRLRTGAQWTGRNKFCISFDSNNLNSKIHMRSNNFSGECYPTISVK